MLITSLVLSLAVTHCWGFSVRTEVITVQRSQDRRAARSPEIELKASASATDLELPTTFAILGGTGRIGTAVASHILLRAPSSVLLLVGRDESRGLKAVAEVLGERPSAQVSFLRADYRNESDLKSVVSEADCLIHTAGPFLSEEPTPLREAISSSRCRAYVDVSDPLDFLDASLSMNSLAEDEQTTALLAAGAFPGMSNVLAVEAASCLPNNSRVRDIRFNYFTAGLGGSGDVNLYITNLGFGEPMAQFENGSLRLFKALSGLLLGKVSFFIEGAGAKAAGGNDVARERIGSQTVFSWPFPEAATVPRELGASGDSSAAMGTAPDVWNTMLGVLVSLVPRELWRSPRFSKFLADFSQPLVKATDLILRLASPDNVGETHAMRVDVTGEDGSAISIIQAHESFRRCVGQSCAEFAIDLLQNPSPGVQLPERRYRDVRARRRILDCLTVTPGTLAFTGPVAVEKAPPPSDLKKALLDAHSAEAKLRS